MSRLVVTTYVLLFLLKLRFPRSVPLSTTIRNRYGNNALTLYRKFAKVDFKLRKAQLDLEFLQRCRTCGVLPKFLNFKLYNSKVTKSLTYKAFQFKLLNLEINTKTKLVKEHKSILNTIGLKFRDVFSTLDYHCLSNRVFKTNVSKIKFAKETHEKKLLSLGISSHHSVDREKVVVNLSKRILTEAEREVLSLGLSYGLPKLKLNKISHYFSFEKLVSTLKVTKSTTFNDVVQGIASVAHSSFKDFQHQKCSLPRLPQNLLDSLKNLKSDNSIIITKPDKGVGTVVLDKCDYISKVESILSDSTKFKQINEDPFKFITRLEDKLARMLRNLLHLKIINKELFTHLLPSGSSLGVLYGLPKIHKLGCPIRPIVNTIGTFNYNLAKSLLCIIEPLTTNTYTLKNSFDFVKEIKSMDLNNKTMASFDIKSLFTNIPLSETIEIIINGLFVNSPKFLNFTRKQFKELLEIAVKESPFLFNESIYVQTDGIAMGSCLGPTFANAFLCFHEARWLSDCPSAFKPSFYRRYVDDTFLLFDDVDHVPLFLNYLNSKHVNIKFTCDHEINNSIPFLDVLVTRSNQMVTTSVYRKPTFTGLGTNFHSFTPRLFKINSIKTLLYRAFVLSSNWSIFDDEIKFLKQFFQMNGYPLYIVENCIKNFLNRIFSPTLGTDDDVTPMYIKLPYYGHLSFGIRKKLCILFKEHLPDKKFRFIFTNNFTLKSFFPYKDSIPQSLISNVVYQYTCPSCNQRYVGETRRNLHLRIAEHKGISARTSKPLSHPSFSAIRLHCLESNHTLSNVNFKILRKCKFPSDTKILESLYIKHTKPELNNQIMSHQLSIP